MIPKLLLLACLAAIQSPSPSQRIPQKNGAHTQESKSENAKNPAPSPATTISSGITEPAPKSEEQRTKHEPSYWEKVLSPEVLPQWILMFVGVIAAIIGLRSLKALETQTEATEIAANAAKSSAETAREALKLSERADVLLEAGSLGGETLKDVRVVVVFKNFGRTRATKVQCSLVLDYPGVPGSDQSGIPSVVLGAGKTQTISSPKFVEALTEATATGIMNGSIPLKFIAEATYEDVFLKKHHTRATGYYKANHRVFAIDENHAD